MAKARVAEGCAQHPPQRQAGPHRQIPLATKEQLIDVGLRPYYLTHEFTIHDAPFDDEIVIAIGGASSGRAHARTGDRYQDMKEMGLDPK